MVKTNRRPVMLANQDHGILDLPALVGMLEVERDRVRQPRGFDELRPATGIVVFVLGHTDRDLNLRASHGDHIPVIEKDEVDLFAVAKRTS